MKKQLFIIVFSLLITNSIFSQIVNTFPLDDSVGIGTTAPSELLDIRGTIYVDGWQIGRFQGPGTTGGNLVVGSQCLLNNISGHSNILLGDHLLEDNISGTDNVAIGVSNLQNNISGNYNIALGSFSLTNNEIGSDNIALGSFSLNANSSGISNVAMGKSSLAASFKGDYNTAIGFKALEGNTKGDYNTALGSNSLDFNKSGNNNTAFGYNADVSAIALSNATAIGNGALVDASNKVRIGNSSVTSNGGQVSWTAYSDARIKTDVKENVPGLEFINLLKPVTYHFDVDKQNEIMGVNSQDKVEGMYDIEKIAFTGFLAQDVEAAAKIISYDFSGLDKSGEILGLRYAEFVVPVVKSIQELSEMNDEKSNEIKELQEENTELENRITILEKYISKQGIVLENEAIEDIYKQSVTVASDNQTAFLSQNVPNPFTGRTNIAYFVPETAQSAHIKIANANGVSLFMAEVRLGNGVLEVDATQLAAGTYSYTLIVDSKVVDTKLMVLQ
jgi:hypothetical protein